MSHVFWSAPRPFMGNGPIRTVPLRLGGRPVGYGGFFMSQGPTNRLDAVPLDELIARGSLSVFAPTVPLERAKEIISDFEALRKAGQRTLIIPQSANGRPIENWNAQDWTALQAVRQNPTPEELRDLSLIDGLYGWINASTNEGACLKMGNRYGYGANEAFDPKKLRSRIVHSGVKQRIYQELDSGDLIASDESPFFCGEIEKIPTLWTKNNSWGAPGGYGIDTKQPWGSAKQSVRNGAAFSKVAGAYPYPSPLPFDPMQTYYYVAKEVADLVHVPYDLPEPFLHFWITMAIVAHYDEIARGIISDMKREARHRKIDALTEKIVIAVALTLLSAGIATVVGAAGIATVAAQSVGSSVTAAISQTISYENMKASAKGLEDLSKAFEASDAGFSKELDDAARTLDAQAAEEQASQPPSPEVQKFSEEQSKLAKDTGTGSGGGTPTGLIVGGIAAGAAATAGALLL